MLLFLCPSYICLCDRFPTPIFRDLKKNNHLLDIHFILCGFIPFHVLNKSHTYAKIQLNEYMLTISCFKKEIGYLILNLCSF